jgi:predicted nucleic acid-binding protein
VVIRRVHAGGFQQVFADNGESDSRIATIGTMIIVVDTNVFVGACLGTGAASRVIAACLSSLHVPLMGAALLSEYEDVLGRHTLFSQCRLSQQEREELLDIYLAHCRWTRIYYGWRPNLADEGDNHLVELAVAGGASHIVTRNLRDLKALELKFPDIRVITPDQFLQEVQP